MSYFKILKKSKKSKARIAKLELPSGSLLTPFFIPLATKGIVKSIDTFDLEKIGVKIILANSYHLFLKPSLTFLKKIGGLKKFINWKGAILTDSGGYQVFSLKEKREIKRNGVRFKTAEGKEFLLTPKLSIKIQKEICSDIFMVLDVCPSFSLKKTAIKKAVFLTIDWAKKSKEAFLKMNFKGEKRPLLFGILQGGIFEDLRKFCAEKLLEIGFDGLAIGGLMVGEPEKDTFRIIKYTTKFLPENTPRYLMGAGYPEQILKAVKEGMDIFDCNIPTRYGRHGELFFFKEKEPDFSKRFYQKVKVGKISYKLKKERLKNNCRCYFCKNFSLSFLHHLYKIKDPLYFRLATIHNLTFYQMLLEKIRKGIKEGKI